MPGGPGEVRLKLVSSMVQRGVAPEQIVAHFGISYSSLDRYLRMCKSMGLLDHGVTLARLVARPLQNSPVKRQHLPSMATSVGGKGDTDRTANAASRDGSVGVSLDSDHILTLEELLAAAQADPKEWEVKEFSPNYFELPGPEGTKVGHWQIKAWLKRRSDEQTIEDRIRPLIERLEKNAYRYPKFKRPKLHTDGKYMLEIFPSDLHYDMLAWGKESGEDYDTHIAAERFNWAMEDLLCKASPYPLEKILFVVGNDLFHSDQTIDGKGGATAHGTPQDVDSRWQKSFKGVEELIIGAIDRFLSIAPVHVVCIPGNHDATKSFYLGEVLQAWFHRCKDAMIDNSPRTRKYVSYGVQLLGFTHGGDFREDKMPLLMAQESPQLWAESKFREWHIGHWHRKKEIKYLPVMEEGGVRVRVLPSLCSADSWHYRQGFTGAVRAAEAYLWEKDTGFAGEFSATWQT